MMKWARAANAAMGVRKYIYLSSATAVPFAYGVLSNYVSDMFGWQLPPLPWLTLAITAFLGLPLIWFLQRLVLLEEELTPHLDISFEDDTHPFSLLDPGVGGRVTRFIRVKVTNTSARTLENCLVKLEEFFDKDGNTGFFVPIGLITQHQLWQQRSGGSFTLRGKESKFVEVAAMPEPSSDGAITLQYETNTAKEPAVRYPNVVPSANGPYTLRLTAFGGGLPASRMFKLFVDAQMKLRMSAIANA